MDTEETTFENAMVGDRVFRAQYRRMFRRDPAMTHYEAEITDAFTFGYKDISQERFEEYMRKTK